MCRFASCSFLLTLKTEGWMSTPLSPLCPCRVSSVPAVRPSDWDQRRRHRQPVLQLHHLLHCAGHRQRDRGGLRCPGASDLLVRRPHPDHQESFHQRHWGGDRGLCWYEHTPNSVFSCYGYLCRNCAASFITEQWTVWCYDELLLKMDGKQNN